MAATKNREKRRLIDMAKLYELAEEVRNLAEQLEEMDLDQQTMLDTLDGSTAMMTLEQKAEGIIKMLKNWEAEVPSYKAEIDQLTAKKVATENRIKSVKEYLKMCLQKAGLTTVKVGIFKPRLQNNSRGSVKILDEKSVPAGYYDIIPEQKVINTERLYQDLKDGKEIPGVLYEVGKHLRVS